MRATRYAFALLCCTTMLAVLVAFILSNEADRTSQRPPADTPVDRTTR